MRSIFAGIIVLSTSMVAHAAEAHKQAPGLPGYDYVQAPVGDRRPTQDDRMVIDKDNQQLGLPARQGNRLDASQVDSEENALSKRIEQDNARLDREIRGICPSC
jgi:hypothetical protein